MGKTLHTEGPWRLQKMRQEGLFSIGMGTFYATGLIGEANAALIVTAPDLLEALNKIAASADDGGQDQLAPDMWAACREIARTAIAKATP